MATKVIKETDSPQQTAIEAGYSAFDTVRTTGLRGILQVRTAQLAMRQRQLAEAKKLKDTATTESLAADVLTQQALIVALKNELIESSTVLPATEPTAAIVHGYVFKLKSALLVPAANISVAVFTPTRELAGKNLGGATTDRQGYYKISIPAAASSANGGRREAGSSTPSDGIVATLDANAAPSATQAAVPLTGGSLSFRRLILSD